MKEMKKQGDFDVMLFFLAFLFALLFMCSVGSSVKP